MTSENIAEYIAEVLIPKLDKDRGEAILAMSNATLARSMRASDKALRAAIDHGVEKEAVALGMKLQEAMWNHVWDSTQGEAPAMTHVLSRLSMGIATAHLVGTGEYGIEDYIALVEPWTSGFPDFPLPIKEKE